MEKSELKKEVEKLYERIGILLKNHFADDDIQYGEIGELTAAIKELDTKTEMYLIACIQDQAQKRKITPGELLKEHRKQ